MMPKVSLRLKLSDFINTDMEQKIMEKINNIYDELHTAILLYLWFEDGEISSKDLKEFLMKWEDKLSFKTVVKRGHKIKLCDFVWFDVVPVNISTNFRNRFRYQYVNCNKILDGLQEFYSVAKFTTLDKPVKKQKRNDYEY